MFRNKLIRGVMRRRFAVTLRANEGVFSGVLTEFDRDIFVFEDCQTVPNTPGGTPDPIAGRVFVERSNIAYIQDLS